MKGITLGADCAYYSMKKHKCTLGAKDEGEPTARFYADCPLDDVAPVVHGQWIVGDPDCAEADLTCSECAYEYDFESGGGDLIETLKHDYKFCPHCGAKMDGERDADG